MSFICKICKKPQPNHVKPIKIVVAEREKVYPPRYKNDELIDYGGIGTEIEEEISVCTECAKLYKE